MANCTLSTVNQSVIFVLNALQVRDHVAIVLQEIVNGNAVVVKSEENHLNVIKTETKQTQKVFLY